MVNQQYDEEEEKSKTSEWTRERSHNLFHLIAAMPGYFFVVLFYVFNWIIVIKFKSQMWLYAHCYVFLTEVLGPTNQLQKDSLQKSDESKVVSEL